MKNRGLIIAILACFFSPGISAKNYPCNTWKTFSENCKVGFIDPEGKVMIKAQFEYATAFSEGLAFVWSYEHQSDAGENVAYGDQYRSYDIIGNSFTGIVDSTGTFILQPKINFRIRTPFRNGIATVVISNKVRIINRKGEIIVPYDPQYDNEYRKILLKGMDTITYKWVYLDAYRHEVYGQFDGVEEYSEGFGAVCIGGKWGYINRAGEMVIPPQYTKADYFHDGLALVYEDFKDDSTQHRYFALIDTLGRVVIESYSWAIDGYSEGKAIYVVTGDSLKGEKLFGYVDSTGVISIPAKFEKASEFSEGLAAVTIDGKTGYINSKGEMVIKPQFEWGGQFHYGTALVNVHNSMAYIDRNGKIIWGPEPKKDCDWINQK